MDTDLESIARSYIENKNYRLLFGKNSIQSLKDYVENHNLQYPLIKSLWYAISSDNTNKVHTLVNYLNGYNVAMQLVVAFYDKENNVLDELITVDVINYVFQNYNVYDLDEHLIIAMWQRCKPYVPAYINSILIEAAKREYMNLVQYLLDDGAQFMFQDGTLIPYMGYTIFGKYKESYIMYSGYDTISYKPIIEHHKKIYDFVIKYYSDIGNVEIIEKIRIYNPDKWKRYFL